VKTLTSKIGGFIKCWLHTGLRDRFQSLVKLFLRFAATIFDKGLRTFRTHVFYKHMKFWNQARLCLAINDFKAHIMLNFSRYRITGMGKI